MATNLDLYNPSPSSRIRYHNQLLEREKRDHQFPLSLDPSCYSAALGDLKIDMSTTARSFVDSDATKFVKTGSESLTSKSVAKPSMPRLVNGKRVSSSSR